MFKGALRGVLLAGTAAGGLVAVMQSAQAAWSGFAYIYWVRQSRVSYDEVKTVIKLTTVSCPGRGDGYFFLRNDTSNKEHQIAILMTAISSGNRISVGYNPDCDVYSVAIEYISPIG
jgi:hypothetical protein